MSERDRRLPRDEDGVISKSVISYISWDLITPVIRLITVRADIISRAGIGVERLGFLVSG